MANMFGINLTTKLVDGKDGSIRSQIDRISKNIQPIKISLDIDKTSLQTIENFNTKLKEMNTTSSQMSKTNTPFDTKSLQNMDSMSKGMSDITGKLRTSSEEAIRTKETLHHMADGYTKLAREVTKADVEGQKLNKTLSMQNSDGTKRRVQDENLRTGQTTITDTQDYSKQDQLAQQLNRSREQGLKYVNAQLAANRLTTGEAREYNRLISQATSLESVKAERSKAGNHIEKLKTNELRTQLEYTRKQAQFNVDRLRANTKGDISPENDKKLKDSLAQMNSIVSGEHLPEGAKTKMRALNQEIGQTTTLVRDADKSWRRFATQASSAMLRIPIYAAGMALLYAPLKAFKSALEELISLDTQMTVLDRVSDGAISTTEALEQSVASAEKLGNRISEVNDGMIAFARQGYRGDDLFDMTDNATVMSNVSDLSVEESASGLTAAMKGFNIEAKDSLHIVNALNEVDNNYAITTAQLSQSLERSAGAASAYGVSLENTIGYTTAIGEVTRESGSVIGFHNKIAV